MSLDVGALYEQAYQPLCVYFHRRLPQSQRYMADDLAADVFEKALRAADRFEQRGLPQTSWLYAIAGNHLVDYVRSLRNVSVFPLDAPVGRNHRDPRAEHELLLAADRVTLAPLIRKLSPGQRRTIVARFIKDMSIADTAKAFGTTEESVKKLQARALASLKHYLSGHPDGQRAHISKFVPGPVNRESRAARRAAVVEMRSQGMSHSKIARTLGVSTDTVAKDMQRAEIEQQTDAQPEDGEP